MYKMDVFGFLVSSFLHIIVLILFAFAPGNAGREKIGSPKDGSGKTRFDGVDVSNILEKTKQTEVSFIQVEKGPGSKKKHKKVNALKDCPGKWYGGIGIQMGFNSKNGKAFEVIDKVFEGYPADLVGLQPGDVILDASGQILGPPGSSIQLKIGRGSQILTFAFLRGRVCY